MLGIAILIAVAMFCSKSILQAMIWGIFGMILLEVTYEVIDKLTPSIPVEELVGKGNVAVSILSGFCYIAFSVIIAVAIS